ALEITRLRPPRCARQLIGSGIWIAGEERQRLIHRPRVVEGLDQRLAQRCRPVEGAAVAPTLEGVAERQMPLAACRGLVTVSAKMSTEGRIGDRVTQVQAVRCVIGR